jgi:virginiamycin B lyase
MKLFFSPMLLLLLILTGLPPTNVQADSSTDIREWLVPWEASGPRDPYVDQKGRVWFCGQRGNYIAYLEPDSGEFKRYAVAKGTHPHNLIVDKDGFVWYAGNRNAHIGKLNPANGEITKYPMPDPDARDPHTLVFNRNGDIWFTLQQSNLVGKLETRTGKVHLVEVQTNRARPYGIKLDKNDRPWVVLFGTNKLATIDPQTMDMEEIALPRSTARPRRLEIMDDGNIWYVDYAGGRLGRYAPDTGEFKEWSLPGGKKSFPYGTARDDRNRLWIAESGIDPNRLVGFDPDTKEFFGMTEVPSGGGTIRHMYFHRPSREVWFGTDTNYIGRLRLTD